MDIFQGMSLDREGHNPLEGYVKGFFHNPDLSPIIGCLYSCPNDQTLHSQSKPTNNRKILQNVINKIEQCLQAVFMIETFN